MTRKSRKTRKEMAAQAGDAAGRKPTAMQIADWVVLPFLILLLSYWLVVRPVFDRDTWFHQAFGQEVLKAGTLPTSDEFSHSAYMADWISSGWLSSVVIAFVNQFTEYSQGGAVYLTFGVVAFAYLLAYALGRRNNPGGRVIGILLLLGLILAAVRFNPRPDIFSHLMLVFLIGILAWWDRSWKNPASNKKRVAASGGILVFFCLALWANLHAGFLLALPILAAFLISIWRVSEGRHRKYLIIAGLIGAMGWLFNPYGARILELPQRIGNIANVAGIVTEWMPFFGSVTMDTPVYLSAIALVVLWVFYMVNAVGRGNGWRWASGALLVFMMLQQRRHTGLVAIGLPALLIGIKPGPVWNSFGRWPLVVGASAAVAFSGMVLKHIGLLGTGDGLPIIGLQCGALPCVTSDFLDANPPPTRLYNDFGAGGFYLHHLREKTQVFIDGRLDIYPADVWDDYIALHSGRLSTEELEKKYELRTWAVDITEGGFDRVHLATRLATRPEMALVHFDDNSAVFVKRDDVTASYIAAHEFRMVNPWKVHELVAAAKRPEDQEALANEIVRALEQSMRSSNANALAAIAAGTLGDSVTEQHYLAEAEARDADNPLIKALKR